jgi:alpha-tubulin suppressor-like RCC1 family protein
LEANPEPDTAALALGWSHSCALTVGGGIRCWGNNAYGQLGNGTNFNSLVPVDVAWLPGGVRAMAAGVDHSCALTAAGGVECWGRNSKGQLGNGSSLDSAVPVQVAGLAEGVAAISAGFRHTCALTTGGGVKCWGENMSGELGDGTNADRRVPVEAIGLNESAVAVDAGGGHTCALMKSGAVKCWGWNSNGQVGDETVKDKWSPVDVAGLSGGAKKIAAGDYHTCAVTDAGAVQCWGANGSGQLGNGSRIQSSAPVPVEGLEGGAVLVAAGGSHSCAIDVAGNVACWGSNTYGQLGTGVYEGSTLPADVGGLEGNMVSIAAGYGHTCAESSAGRLQCWGWNGDGQLGDGTASARKAPATVAGWSGEAADLSIGWARACVVTGSGAVKCWGSMGNGLPEGGSSAFGIPATVDSLAGGAAAVSAGGEHACALTAGGGVKCWGRNSRGQLGDGTREDRATPVEVAGLSSGVAAVSAGYQHTCARMVDGGIRCWGANDHGQLGDGTRMDRADPVEVEGLSAAASIVAAGGGHTCAVASGGGLLCWGWNSYGQLGDDTQEDRLRPEGVAGLEKNVLAVSVGGFHTCAITAGDGMKCWGWNTYGQLGDSTPTDRKAPVEVRWLVGAPLAIATGYDYTCALLHTGILRCWGNNDFGQLGDGTTTVRNTPVNVAGLNDRVIAVRAGFYTTCILAGRGGIQCWGNNSNGLLGNGITTNSSRPVDVLGLGE